MKIVGISTCKGRLAHIQITAQAFLEAMPTSDYLLVDYTCPDKSGEWVTNTFGHTNRAHSLLIRSREDVFHKTIALNAGSKYAIFKLKADYLLYFDADTIIHKGFMHQVLQVLTPEKFVIVNPAGGEKDLTGFLIIHKDIFTASGGFEESFRSWGSEDLEFRLRLFVKHNYNFDVIGCENLSSIHHDDNMRVKFYTDKDIDFSNKRNFYRLRQMYQRYAGKDLKISELQKDPDENLCKLLAIHQNTNYE